MSTPKLKSQPLHFQLILIGGFIFIAFMLFALARSIYRDSFQVGSYIDRSLTLVETQKVTTVNEKSELAYVQTRQYQEKIAKELLGLKSPGEEVIILTGETQDIADLLPEAPIQLAQRERELLTGPQKWWRYLFGI